jgi:hypothetical protein
MQQVHIEIPFTIDPSDPSYVIFSSGKRVHTKQLKTLGKKLARDVRKIAMAAHQCGREDVKDAT